jgi:uncharacterized membrane protein
MAKTIGNPMTWTVQNMRATSSHVGANIDKMGGDDAKHMPQVRRLELSDLREVLIIGFQDFSASRADVIFIGLIYPLVGLVLITAGLSMNLLPLVVPLIMGFALLSPVAAIGLYEISRLREAGENPDWLDAFGVLRSPALGGIVVLGLYLAALFIGWIMTAGAVYSNTLGPEPPVSVLGFVSDVFTTSAGWAMIVIGTGLGVVFAVLALSISLVSFPLLLDRQVGLPVAVVTSVRVVRASPVVAFTWGAIVAICLGLGAIPMLMGLIVAVPVLGHATWHLYRRAVE